jgi:heat shock protein HtpX
MSRFYNNVKTALLLGLLTALVVWIGSLFGTGGLYVGLILAAVMNFVSFFFSDKIAIMAMRAQEVGPGHELYSIVEELVQRSNVPMPRVYVAPHAAPNAFATGRGPRNAAVCATEGLLRMLSRDEIAGVMAHELAHVKHRDILIQSVATTIGGAIGMLPYFFMFGGHRDEDGEGANPFLMLIVILLAPIGAAIIQAAISRSREFDADRGGAEILGNPLPLATALEKIHATVSLGSRPYARAAPSMGDQ